MWTSTIRLAWRNIWRQPRRTAIVTLAIGLGLCGLLVGLGYVAGVQRYLVATATSSLIGDIQIHAPSYRESHDPELVLPEVERLIQRAEATEGVAAVSPRAFGTGLLVLSADELADVLLMGVDLARERRVLDWDDKFVAGAYPDAPDGVLIGKDLSDRMGISVGQVVDLTVFNLSTLRMDSLKVRVSGVLSTGNPRIDWNTVVIPLPQLQAKLRLPGAVHELAVRLDERGRAPGQPERIVEQLQGAGIEVSTWRGIVPTLAKLVEMQSVYFNVAVGIILVLTALGIVNVIKMSFVERTREFGTLIAVGTSPARLALLLFAEAASLGVVGALAGLLLLTLVYAPLSRTGIYIGEMSAAGVRIPSRIFPELDAVSVGVISLVYIALPAIVAVSSAIRVTRLDPVTALREP